MSFLLRHGARIGLIGLVGLIAWGAWPGVAHAQPSREDELKAQVVLRSLLFFEWSDAPAATTQPLVLCLLGKGGFADALERLRGEIVNQRPLDVRRLATTELRPCQIAYVGPVELQALQGRPPTAVLLGDTQGLLTRGVALNVLTDQNRVVFDVNLPAARACGVQISARLLRLARFVMQE